MGLGVAQPKTHCKSTQNYFKTLLFPAAVFVESAHLVAAATHWQAQELFWN